MTDNEKIIEILSETQQFMKGRLVPLIEADPPSIVIARYMDALQNIGGIINELGDQNHGLGYPSPGYPAVFDRLAESTEAMHKRLIAIEATLSEGKQESVSKK